MFKLSNAKKLHCSLSKISLHYQPVIDQRLTLVYQLFSWTSKCPIDKMIGLQGHLTVQGVSRVPYVLPKNSLTYFFSELNKCSN